MTIAVFNWFIDVSRGNSVSTIQEINASHAEAFLKAVRRSSHIHGDWVSPPADEAAFARHSEKYSDERNYSFVALNDREELLGCINLNEIVRGSFQSAYMGYYVFSPFQGKGLMSTAMRLVIQRAFDELGLHRLEANVQPANRDSSTLLLALGFRLEGHSPRYLKIRGEWCDHDRYALTSEEFEKQAD